MEVQGQLLEVQVEADDKEMEQHLLSASSPPEVRPALWCPLSLVRCCRCCCFRLLDFPFDLGSSELDSQQKHHLSWSLRTHSLSHQCVPLLRKRLVVAKEEEDTGCREHWLKRNRDQAPCGSGS